MASNQKEVWAKGSAYTLNSEGLGMRGLQITSGNMINAKSRKKSSLYVIREASQIVLKMTFSRAHSQACTLTPFPKENEGI